MYSSLRLLLLLFVSALVAFSLGLGVEPATRAADAEEVIERFPIGKDTSSVLLPVTINGKRFRLCVDTGSPWTAYDISLRHLLGKMTAREKIGTQDESIKIPFFEPPDARLGKLALPKDSPVMGIDLSESNKCSGEEWQGLLGMDFLKAHIFRIDIDRGEVVFLRAVGPDPGQRLAIRLTNYVPQVKINLLGLKEPEWFVVDTGCVRGDGAIWGCFRKAVFDDLIKSGKLTSIYKQRQTRFAGERMYRFGWLDSLPFAGNTHKNLLFSEEDFSMLGLELLSRFVVTFDFPHQAIFLKKGRQFDRLYRQQLSGLSLERVKGQTVVESVVVGSPAAQAGIRSGDTLLQIDKQAIDSMTLFTLRNRLSEERKRVQLTVRRGAQRLDMSLILSGDIWKRGGSEKNRKGGRPCRANTGDEVYRRGVRSLNEGDLDESLDAFNEAIRLDPKKMVAYWGRSTIYSAKGENRMAIADLDRAIQLEPKEYKLYYNRGVLHARQGAHDQAITDFNKTLDLNPKNFNAYHSRAISRAAQRGYDAALADLAEALRLCSKDDRIAAARIHLDRGTVYLEKNDYGRAIDAYTEAIRLEPKEWRSYHSRGIVYQEKKEYDKALADFSEAIRFDPKQSEAYARRGDVHELKKEFNKAIADWRRCLQLAPKDEESYNSLAWLLATCPQAKVRDGKKAVEYARKACELTKGQDANKLETLAAAYAESGDFKQAMRWQTKAVELAAKESPEQRKEMETRLALYKVGKPYREERE